MCPEAVPVEDKQGFAAGVLLATVVGQGRPPGVALGGGLSVGPAGVATLLGVAAGQIDL